MKMYHFKWVSIQQEISNLNSKKAAMIGNIPTEVLKESSNVCNAVLRDKNTNMFAIYHTNKLL